MGHSLSMSSNYHADSSNGTYPGFVLYATGGLKKAPMVCVQSWPLSMILQGVGCILCL